MATCRSPCFLMRIIRICAMYSTFRANRLPDRYMGVFGKIMQPFVGI